MDKLELFEYIKANKLSTPVLSALSGLSQSTIYRAVYKNANMSYDNVEKLKKVVNDLFSGESKRRTYSQNDEFLVNMASESIHNYSNNYEKILKDQSEALRLSSEHLGKLLEQNSRLFDQIERMSAQIIELESKLTKKEGM